MNDNTLLLPESLRQGIKTLIIRSKTDSFTFEQIFNLLNALDRLEPIGSHKEEEVKE